MLSKTHSDWSKNRFIRQLPFLYKEQSIDDFCQFLIETGIKVYSHEVDDFLCLGTPDEFRTYEYWLESNEISNIK